MFKPQHLWVTGMTAAVLSDQLSKWWVLKHLSPHQPWEIFPGFSWYLTYNSGIAFSFFASANAWVHYLLIAFTFIVCAYLVHLLYSLPANRGVRAGLVLIIGGAMGNLIDRIFQGQVIDFISVYYGDWSFPIFNVADIWISVGAALWIFCYPKNKAGGK